MSTLAPLPAVHCRQNHSTSCSDRRPALPVLVVSRVEHLATPVGSATARLLGLSARRLHSLGSTARQPAPHRAAGPTMLQSAASAAAVGRGTAAAVGATGRSSFRSVSRSSSMIGCRAAGRLAAAFGRSRGLHVAVGSNRQVGALAPVSRRAVLHARSFHLPGSKLNSSLCPLLLVAGGSAQ
jgi:hypothetical protein